MRLEATCRAIATMGAMLAFAPAALAADKAALAAEGKAAIQAFGGALKKELVAAVESQGPAYAIGVCNIRAPEIAQQVSAATGWSVARSSHKLRNPANAPDDFTAEAIAEFLAREAKGEKAADMAKAAVVEEDGKQVFRLVKAIPTGKLCLNCHGTAIQESVAAKLDELYPDDQARGFSEGQMRGVFTLKKVLD